jgi:periplasmic protein TonB
MTLQIRGFGWSIGLHGLILLAFIVLQTSVISQSKITVIDFTLGGNAASPAVQQTSPQREAEPLRKTERPAPRLREAVTERNIPGPEPQRPQPVSQVSAHGKEVPAFSSHEIESSGMTSAAGSSKAAVAAAGPVHDRARARPAGSGGTVDSAEHAQTNYLREHFAYIRDRINRSISYPHLARKMGWCGQVKVAFVVCEDGGVNDLKIVAGSGYGLLDRNALDTVRKVSPFPRPPVKAEIRMAITYRLD